MLRIRLVPLTVEQVELYLREDFSFENSLALAHYPRKVEPPFRVSLVERIMPKLLAFPEHHVFYTLWSAVDTTTETAVAGIVFKGPPNNDGEVEIGYGTLPDFMRKGYMTEVVQLACEWAFAQPGVKKVVAETDLDNFASQKILLKNGFVKVGEGEKLFKWELLSLSQTKSVF